MRKIREIKYVVYTPGYDPWNRVGEYRTVKTMSKVRKLAIHFGSGTTAHKTLHKYCRDGSQHISTVARWVFL